MIIFKKRPFKTIQLPIHIGAWTFFYLFNIGVVFNSGLPIHYSHELTNLLLFMLVFYTNYLLLMRLFIQKKFVLFIALSVVLLSSSIWIKSNSDHKLGQGMKGNFLPFSMEKFENKINQEKFRLLRPRHELINFRRTLALSFSVLFVFFLSFSIRIIQKWLEDEKLKSQLEKEKVEAELAYLKQQINPHFLFNSLNSIYSLSISKSEQTTPSILKLSSILRYMLYDTDETTSDLSTELTVVKDYIELQKLRLTDKVEVELNVKGSAEYYLLEPFIILPIIENAFKYGVDNLNNSFIKIDINILEGLLNLKVENNVVLRPALKRKGSGIGLTNIKRRLEILYPNSHYFHSQESNEIFSVNMEIKLKSI